MCRPKGNIIPVTEEQNAEDFLAYRSRGFTSSCRGTFQLKEKNRMDFIERLFGISPDGGNSLTEVSYILLLALLILVLFRREIARLAFHRRDSADR
jgi:hypothetical protein